MILNARIDTTKLFFAAVNCLFLFAAAACTAVGQVRIDTIALTGQEAPGFDPPAAFSADSFDFDGFFRHRTAYINQSGQVLFGGEAFTSPPGSNHDDGLWVSQNDGSLRLVVRERESAPGTDAAFGSCGRFDGDGNCTRPDNDNPFDILGLSNAGDALFISTLVGPELVRGTTWGIWSERGGDLRLVARVGDPAPDTTGTFSDLDTDLRSGGAPVPINGNGLLTFAGELDDDHTRIGLYVEEASGSLRLMTQTGELAPGTGRPFVDFGRRFIAADGNVTFGGLFETPAGDDRLSGIWRSTPDGVAPLVLPGDIIPGVEGDRKFRLARPSSMNADGDIVFSASSFTRTDLPVFRVDGLFVAAGDGVRKVVVDEEPLAALPGSTVFNAGGGVIDAHGRAAFVAEVGQEDVLHDYNSVLAERDGQLKVIAGPDTLPGLMPDEFLRQIDDLSGNASGQLLFRAFFEPSCADPDDPFACDYEQRKGYWIADADGDLSLIARTGDMVEVAPGDWRTIGTLWSVDGPHLNDRGQFAFVAQFLDGTQGVLRAQLVPEPASWLLMLGGCAFAVTAGRHRRSSGRMARH